MDSAFCFNRSSRYSWPRLARSDSGMKGVQKKKNTLLTDLHPLRYPSAAGMLTCLITDGWNDKYVCPAYHKRRNMWTHIDLFLSNDGLYNLPADPLERSNNRTILGYSTQVFLHGCSCQATGGYLPPAKGAMYSARGVQLDIVFVRIQITEWDYYFSSSESCDSQLNGSFEKYLISCENYSCSSFLHMQIICQTCKTQLNPGLARKMHQ